MLASLVQSNGSNSDWIYFTYDSIHTFVRHACIDRRMRTLWHCSMVAQLYYNPSANATALMHEFLDGYYSPLATPLLMAHMRLYHDAVETTNWRVCASDNCE